MAVFCFACPYGPFYRCFPTSGLHVRGFVPNSSFRCSAVVRRQELRRAVLAASAAEFDVAMLGRRFGHGSR